MSRSRALRPPRQFRCAAPPRIGPRCMRIVRSHLAAENTDLHAAWQDWGTCTPHLVQVPQSCHKGHLERRKRAPCTRENVQVPQSRHRGHPKWRKTRTCTSARVQVPQSRHPSSPLWRKTRTCTSCRVQVLESCQHPRAFFSCQLSRPGKVVLPGPWIHLRPGVFLQLSFPQRPAQRNVPFSGATAAAPIPLRGFTSPEEKSRNAQSRGGRLHQPSCRVICQFPRAPFGRVCV